jgi:predicted acyltransferase
LRGIILAAMILVNTAGNYSTTYWPLKHAEWNGWTPTDLIFPSFLFMMGVAMTLSFPSRFARGATVPTLVRHIVLRSLGLFAIGLFVNAFPEFEVSTWRIPGVLQRFAACYLVVGLIYLFTRKREPVRANIPVIVTIAIVCLVAYWALMTFVPVPGYGTGHLDPEGNLGAYIDRSLLGQHLYAQTKVYDPEGVLSTLPAFATALFGILAGEWLRSATPQMRKTAGLLGAGIALMILGEALHPFFPINKKLWTSTFVLFTSGFTTLSLGICYWVFDVRRWRRFLTPALVFGTNSILAYTLSEIIEPIFERTHVHDWFYNHALASWLPPYNASLAYSLLYVFLIFLLILPLYQKRIFVRL